MSTPDVFDPEAPAVDEELPPLGYEGTLNFTQQIRRKVVGHYMARGVPNDVKEVNTMLKALSDMDRTALDERKNTIDQGNADSSKTVAEAMREFISLQKNSNPFQRNTEAGDRYDGTVPKVDMEKLGQHEVVPGETEIGVVVESSTDFMKRMDAIREQQMKDEG